MSASVSMPLGGVQVGSFDSYEQAQAAVDYLSDQKFAVENVTIIGSDLRQVEQVTGRLTMGRAIAAGAAGGAWWGLFVGLLLGIFSTDGAGWIGSVLSGLLVGLVFGAIFGGDRLLRHGRAPRLRQHQPDRGRPLRRHVQPGPRRGGPGAPGPLLAPRLAQGGEGDGARPPRTPRESTPGRMGIRARTVAACCASGVRPGPSAPSSTAVRGCATGSTSPRSTASGAGVSATVV